MAEYDFYASILRFVSSTATRTDPRVAAMMDCLEQAADYIDADGYFRVEIDQRELYARALAGVAAFLQERILPETIGEENKEAETQVRWAVDTSLEALNQILKAQADGLQATVTINFPDPPPPITPAAPVTSH
jgi:hypothetical protein